MLQHNYYICKLSVADEIESVVTHSGVVLLFVIIRRVLGIFWGSKGSCSSFAKLGSLTHILAAVPFAACSSLSVHAAYTCICIDIPCLTMLTNECCKCFPLFMLHTSFTNRSCMQNLQQYKCIRLLTNTSHCRWEYVHITSLDLLKQLIQIDTVMQKCLWMLPEIASRGCPFTSFDWMSCLQIMIVRAGCHMIGPSTTQMQRQVLHLHLCMCQHTSMAHLSSSLASKYRRGSPDCPVSTSLTSLYSCNKLRYLRCKVFAGLQQHRCTSHVMQEG